MKNLVKDASMGPLREALQRGVEITKLSKEDMRPVMLKVLVKYVLESKKSEVSGHLKRKKALSLHGSLLITD